MPLAGADSASQLRTVKVRIQKQENLIIQTLMARKPNGSHLAYNEWALSVKLLKQNIIIITHAKINGRATINLKIY